GRTATELHTFPGFSASVCQIRPQSEGSVEIRSPDPAAAPKVHFNYLATEFDRRSMLQGLRQLLRVMRQPALAPYNGGAIEFDGNADSDAALFDLLRARGGSAMHAARTCRMGVDAGAVLDTSLRVRGVGRLRVIDASSMPEISAGNTNAPVIMMAEKGADLILEDARGGAS
ncbi:MAG: choline dehydrogenase, partial [Betaproteobacteria bacterium]|nr:choline dehydrogenase [Betaproteobacteria bacterium]